MVFHVAAPVRIGGEDFVVDVLVKSDVNINRMYVHEVVLREKLRDSAFKIGAVASSMDGKRSEAEEPGAIYSVIRKIFDVNPASVSPEIDPETGEPLAEALSQRPSLQSPDTAGRATPEEIAAAEKHILDTLGESVELIFREFLQGGAAGLWTPRARRNLIELSLSGDVLGTAYHESLHQLFHWLQQHGAERVKALLERVATSPWVREQLERLLEADPRAIAQLDQPEEAAAYAYQFWRAGLLRLGPPARNLFTRLTDALRRLFGLVRAEARDAAFAEAVLAAFSHGALRDTAQREAILKAMNENPDLHRQQVTAFGQALGAFERTVGQALFSAEAMMKLSGNRHLADIARRFSQDAGEAMSRQAYFDALKQQRDLWMNRFEDIIRGAAPEDLEIVRQALSTGRETHAPKARRITEALRQFNEDFYRYLRGRGAQRWDPDAVDAKWGTRGAWVDLPYRANYFPRVWNSETIRDRADRFQALLLRHHRKELELIAADARREVAKAENEPLFRRGGRLSVQGETAREEARRRQRGEAAREITAERIAQTIVARLSNGSGQSDLSETGGEIGVSPFAPAVNRRELDWIDDRVFDEFKEKDLVRIFTSYLAGMVRRAEYTRSFGPGGEQLGERVHQAILLEMGGDELIERARQALPAAVARWKRDKAAALQAGADFAEPFPTLRSVGQELRFADVGRERGMRDLEAALRKLEPGLRAIQAMEGTLGHDISPLLRKTNSVLVTYQVTRLLALSLFASMNDIMGLVVNGAELKDAWREFVTALREIRLTWAGDKSTDAPARRAALWGTVEASAALDALGQTWGSVYLDGRMRRISEAVFRWNGMNAWNRAMRITATSVAERIITDYAKNGFDATDPAARARFERLFGKDFDPRQIRLDADGRLDVNDEANQAAMMRWVKDAVMTPDASHRPAWASDPRFVVFWQLKQFAYTLHRVMLRNALAQMRLGNYRPAAALFLGYAPVMIAADAVKEMLIPGEEPPWMQGGLDDYLAHGFDRAGVLGVPQLLYDGVSHDYGASLFGPTIGQILNAPFDEAERTALGALPAGTLWRRAA
jgi:hypothetical protein